MKTNNVISCFVVLLISVNIYAQKLKIEVTSGNLSFLKEVKNLKIVYDYSDLLVGEMAENDYINKKMMEEDLKNPSGGQIWLEKWKNDRSAYYEPKFEELWNKYLVKIPARRNMESDIIMMVHTTWIEPGFSTGVMGYGSRPSLIDLTITFTKNGNETAVVKIANSPGGGSYYAAERIGESYAKAAKTLAGYVLKAIK